MTLRLDTPRLRLRQFAPSDAPRLHVLVNDYDIARMVTPIAYPYSIGHAEEFIQFAAAEMASGKGYHLAVTRRNDDLLVGAISIGNDLTHRRGEMGYWLGKAYWGQGYTTEAAGRILWFGFTDLQLNRIYATLYTHNPASGRVMQKLGMTYEGVLRQYVYKFGQFVDLAVYSILRSEYTIPLEAE